MIANPSTVRNDIGPRERYEWFASRPGRFILRHSVTGTGLNPEPVSTLWTRGIPDSSAVHPLPQSPRIIPDAPAASNCVLAVLRSGTLHISASVTQLRRLVAGLSPRSLEFDHGQFVWDLRWKKWHYAFLFRHFSFSLPLSPTTA